MNLSQTVSNNIIGYFERIYKCENNFVGYFVRKITILRQKIILFPIAEGGAKIFGVFRVKNHDFMPCASLLE
jgi:nucleoid-associated protein YejK